MYLMTTHYSIEICSQEEKKRIQNIDHCRNLINGQFGISIDFIDSVVDVSWVLYNGQKFICNEGEVVFGIENGLPEFGRIETIWISTENSHILCISVGSYTQVCLF